MKLQARLKNGRGVNGSVDGYEWADSGTTVQFYFNFDDLGYGLKIEPVVVNKSEVEIIDGLE
jgi:hypothetical protein